MIGPGHKTPCRQQRRAIGGKWQQAGSPGHGNQPATALLRGVPRKDTGIARIQGLPEKSPPWAHGDEWSHPCLRRPYRCPFGRAGTNESTTPPGRQRNPGNRAIQKTGQQKSPTLPAAYQQGQAFGGGGELGVWRAASAGARRKRWRREGDSNPRRAINPYTLSRRAT